MPWSLSKHHLSARSWFRGEVLRRSSASGFAPLHQSQARSMARNGDQGRMQVDALAVSGSILPETTGEYRRALPGSASPTIRRREVNRKKTSCRRILGKAKKRRLYATYLCRGTLSERMSRGLVYVCQSEKSIFATYEGEDPRRQSWRPLLALPFLPRRRSSVRWVGQCFSRAYASWTRSDTHGIGPWVELPICGRRRGAR